MIDGLVSVFSNSRWRHNVAGGAVIDVTLRGTRRSADAELVDDPAEVAAVYDRLIGELGVTASQRRLGIRINVDRRPTRSELAEAVLRSGLSIIRVHPR